MARSTRSDSAREAHIDSSASVRGRITGEGNLTIEGKVEGDIQLRGCLTIQESGSVVSNVEAQSVVIAGTLEGDVTASGTVRITSGSHVRGNMHGEAVSIEEGAQFAGRLESQFELPAALMGSESRTARR